MGLTVWARQEKIIHGSNNLFCGTEGHPPPRPGKRNSTMLFINMHSQQNLQEYFFCKHIFFLSSLLIIPQMQGNREGIPKKHSFSWASLGNLPKLNLTCFYFDPFLKVKNYPKLRAGWGRGNLGKAKRKGAFFWGSLPQVSYKMIIISTDTAHRGVTTV